MVAAIIALLLSVLPLSNLAYIPAIIALVFGIIALVVKKEEKGKKTINLSFLLTVIALGFTVYKSIFATAEIGDIKDLELKANQSVEESLETLENEIDVIEEKPVVETIPEDFQETLPEKPVQDKEEPKTTTPKEEIPLEDF